MKGFVYVIRSHQTDDIYIGSTTQQLCKRIATHRQDYKKYLNKKHLYMTSFEIIKYDDAYIELLEETEFTNKQELYAREGHHIRSNKCVNKNIMGRTHKERYELNKEHIKENMLKWREDNKEYVKEYKLQYNKSNREQINESRRQSKANKTEEELKLIATKKAEYDKQYRELKAKK